MNGHTDCKGTHKLILLCKKQVQIAQTVPYGTLIISRMVFLQPSSTVTLISPELFGVELMEGPLTSLHLPGKLWNSESTSSIQSTLHGSLLHSHKFGGSFVRSRIQFYAEFELDLFSSLQFILKLQMCPCRWSQKLV